MSELAWLVFHCRGLYSTGRPEQRQLLCGGCTDSSQQLRYTASTTSSPTSSSTSRITRLFYTHAHYSCPRGIFSTVRLRLSKMPQCDNWPSICDQRCTNIRLLLTKNLKIQNKMQHVQYAKRLICNMCNLQHVQFATLAICNMCNLQHVQSEEYPHLYYGSEEGVSVLSFLRFIGMGLPFLCRGHQGHWKLYPNSGLI